MDIFDYIGESIGDDNVSHMLVHIHVNLPAEDDVSNDDDDDDDVDNNDNSDSNDGDVNVKSGSSASQVQLDKYGEIAYTETVLKFASNKVMKLVTQKLESRIRQRLLEKTKADTGNTLLGTSFEYLAHRILRNGGKFDIRPLDKYSGEVSSDPDAVVDLHTQDEQLYFSKNNIDVIENKMYYQPTEKNFPSIDSIIAPNKVFQMTLAENHPIKTSGLKLLYKKFGGDSAQHLVYFYFVVPEHLYEVYKLQKFVNSDDDDAQRIPKWIDKRIFQYVLKIKL